MEHLTFTAHPFKTFPSLQLTVQLGLQCSLLRPSFTVAVCCRFGGDSFVDFVEQWSCFDWLLVGSCCH